MSQEFWPGCSRSLLEIFGLSSFVVRPCIMPLFAQVILWLVDIYQHTFANRSHVKYEFTNTKKLVKKLARIEASSICRQQFANVFADCFCAVHTHQLEFANMSLPTLVGRVKAA